MHHCHLQGGCIIRAVFLDDIYQAYKRNPGLENLMMDKEFAEKLIVRRCPLHHIIAAPLYVADRWRFLKGEEGRRRPYHLPDIHETSQLPDISPVSMGSLLLYLCCSMKSMAEALIERNL